MKSFRIISALLCALALVSCGKSARISGTVSQAPDSKVIVKLLDVNSYKVLDTVSTDSKGRFSYKVNVKEAQPDFIYLFYNDTKIASLLLNEGDKVQVEADTLGEYSVAFSEESALLQDVEKRYSSFLSDCRIVLAGIDRNTSETDIKQANKQLSKLYVDYYRSSLKYILEHKGSLTCVPVLYQSVSEGFPVFNRESDAVYFRAVCDSLKTLYPASRYVKALEKETARRENILALNTRLQQADESGYPDIVMPDVKGEKRLLSETDAKVILLHFWTASDNAQKMFNLDFLKPVWDKFDGKNFQIFSVAIDTDKSTWASAVKNLPWINVCDGLGLASPVVTSFALSEIPVSYLIVNGEIVSDNLSDRASLEKAIAKYLK